jgi:hypothetical protein
LACKKSSFELSTAINHIILLHNLVLTKPKRQVTLFHNQLENVCFTWTSPFKFNAPSKKKKEKKKKSPFIICNNVTQDLLNLYNYIIFLCMKIFSLTKIQILLCCVEFFSRLYYICLSIDQSKVEYQ